MKKILRRILFISASLCVVGYGMIYWLSLPPSIPIREYPWWENYGAYWKSTWIQLLKERTRVHPAKLLFCDEMASQERFGLKVAEIQLCYDLDEDRIIWKRYGLFGLLTGYQSWSNDEYDYDEFLPNGLYLWFPHGPYSLLTPRAPKTEKTIVEKPITNEELLNAFVKLSTELEYDPFGNANRISLVDKRIAPVRLIVDDFSNDKLFDGKTVSEWVDELLVTLSELTGLDMQRIERGQEPENMVLAFMYKEQREEFLDAIKQIKDDEMKRKVTTGYIVDIEQLPTQLYRKDSECYATTISSMPSQITIAANIFIIYFEGVNVAGCIHEEITQTLGLHNDLRELEPTIFNDNSPHEILTSLDKIMLQILYDPRIEPGMTAEQVRPVAKAVIGEYRQQGKLNNLKKRVYQP